MRFLVKLRPRRRRRRMISSASRIGCFSVTLEAASTDSVGVVLWDAAAEVRLIRAMADATRKIDGRVKCFAGTVNSHKGGVRCTSLDKIRSTIRGQRLIEGFILYNVKDV